MSDFNCQDIDWENWTSGRDSSNFLNVVMDTFLHQHVDRGVAWPKLKILKGRVREVITPLAGGGPGSIPGTFLIAILPASREKGPSDITNSVDPDQPLHDIEKSYT